MPTESEIISNVKLMCQGIALNDAQIKSAMSTIIKDLANRCDGIETLEKYKDITLTANTWSQDISGIDSAFLRPVALQIISKNQDLRINPHRMLLAKYVEDQSVGLPDRCSFYGEKLYWHKPTDQTYTATFWYMIRPNSVANFPDRYIPAIISGTTMGVFTANTDVGVTFKMGLKSSYENFIKSTRFSAVGKKTKSEKVSYDQERMLRINEL